MVVDVARAATSGHPYWPPAVETMKQPETPSPATAASNRRLPIADVTPREGTEKGPAARAATMPRSPRFLCSPKKAVRAPRNHAERRVPVRRCSSSHCELAV